MGMKPTPNQIQYRIDKSQDRKAKAAAVVKKESAYIAELKADLKVEVQKRKDAAAAKAAAKKAKAGKKKAVAKKKPVAKKAAPKKSRAKKK